jgi:hypothetical protein
MYTRRSPLERAMQFGTHLFVNYGFIGKVRWFGACEACFYLVCAVVQDQRLLHRQYMALRTEPSERDQVVT